MTAATVVGFAILIVLAAISLLGPPEEHKPALEDPAELQPGALVRVTIPGMRSYQAVVRDCTEHTATVDQICRSCLIHHGSLHALGDVRILRTDGQLADRPAENRTPLPPVKSLRRVVPKADDPAEVGADHSGRDLGRR
jgi:hypothetical protein